MIIGFLESASDNADTTVNSILMMIAVSKIPTQIDTTGPSNSLILIDAPVRPNRIGSKIIQKISNAVAAGLSSISQPEPG
ncbi:unnamed protein product [Acanthoscelides obtectus]|uniref:Uncharacterized protein n=1 Tax=Acanthoscelides obtectus TaxID=200917 RepID=A0A9P0NWF0_ACAOB|nr:unnamed protein product [Acanthoscelides obtectus]CAK1648968.1 hypothetical protein AOBTE_LOCUS15976 [Acanthoscelides obtectus]